MTTKTKVKYVTCCACHGSGGTLTETCVPCGSTGKVVAVTTPETIVLGEN
jgi:DnaJ-class molecular chaperone